MTNEEFQKLILEKLSSIEVRLNGVEVGLGNVEENQKSMQVKLSNLEENQKSMQAKLSNLEESLKNVEVRQDEIYQVVRAIEHSNNVGRAKLDEHEYRIARTEGTFKKFKKALDEMDKASNL